MNGWKLWVVICGIIAAAALLGGAASATTYNLTPNNDNWTDFPDNFATVNAFSGNDILKGLNRADTLNGDSGADNVQGGDGDDTITLGAGDDQGYGGYGDDVIRDQDGEVNGYLEGGPGAGAYDVCYGDWNDSTGKHDTLLCDENHYQHIG